MTKERPTSFTVFILVIIIVVVVFITAALFAHYQVNKKYSMILALFMIVAMSFTTVGIYSGFKFRAAEKTQKQLNFVGLGGNLFIFLFTIGLMVYAAVSKAR